MKRKELCPGQPSPRAWVEFSSPHLTNKDCGKGRGQDGGAEGGFEMSHESQLREPRDLKLW